MQIKRRAVLQGAGAASVAAGLSGLTARSASAAVPSTAAGTWTDFDRVVKAEFRKQRMVGTAIAVVSGDRVLHRLTLGVRDATQRARVTPDTHFLVASTTKSMSSLLVATYVDEGKLDWDQPVVDAWSGFRAPTPELTRSLRVRDLLGMGTGILEPERVSAFHQGDPTADEVVQSLVNLPVVAPPETQWLYNNTVYTVGAYLPLLATGVKPADLGAAYTEAMHKRVFGPAGMADTLIADDPRGRVDTYSRGHVLDTFGHNEVMPYGPVGPFAPVGGALSTLNDMADYVRLELRRGLSTSGERVVSAANLEQCWHPHVAVPTSPELDPDALRAGYAMGWIREDYRGGASLVWHNGAIDGFTTFIGFLPDHDLGIVVLNNMNPFPNGLYWYPYVLNLILSNRFGVNDGTPKAISAAAAKARTDLLTQGKTLHPVDPTRVRPYLGYYEGGFRLLLRGSTLRMEQQSRVIELRHQDGDTYPAVDGLLPGLPVRLFRDADGVPAMDVGGTETVRRVIGLG